jgi:hypothetical protein
MDQNSTPERKDADDIFDPLSIEGSEGDSSQVTPAPPPDTSIQITSKAAPIANAVVETNQYDQAVDRLLSQVINLSPDNILHEPTCEICRAAHREEVEQKWADTKSYEDVRKILRDKCNIPNLSKSVIQNHMMYHVDRAIREIQKIEYVNRIKRLNSFNLSTLERIRLGMSAITERLMGVNSIVPDNATSASEIEKIKTQETARLMTSLNQLLKLQAEILGEMKSSGELVTIPRDEFIRVFNEAILEAKTDEQRDTIKDILNKLAAINKAAH